MSPVSVSFTARDGSRIELENVTRTQFVVDRLVHVSLSVAQPEISLAPGQTVLADLIVTNLSNDTVAVRLSIDKGQVSDLVDVELEYDRADTGRDVSVPLAPGAQLPVRIHLTGADAEAAARSETLLIRTTAVAPDGTDLPGSESSEALNVETRRIDDTFDSFDLKDDGIATVGLSLLRGGFLTATKAVAFLIPVQDPTGPDCFAAGARLTDRKARSHCAVYTIRIAGLEDLGDHSATGLIVEDPLPEGVRFAGVRAPDTAGNAFLAAGVQLEAMLEDRTPCTYETHEPGRICTVRVSGAALGRDEAGEIEIATIIR